MIRYYHSVLLLTLPSAWAAQWIRTASSHFEIQTDASERTAHGILARCERARRVLASADRPEPKGIRTRILLFASAREYAEIRPASGATAFYQSGPDRDYIVALATPELDRAILHEYLHARLNHSSAPLPQWLEEGLAELYSTLAIAGHRATLGAPVDAHVVTLANVPWLSASDLAAVDGKSGYYNEAGKTGIFYAESWALTHLLAFGTGHPGTLASFIRRLTDGEPPPRAFEREFHRTLDGTLTSLPAYIRAGFRTIEIELPPMEQVLFPATTRLDSAQASQSWGEVLLLMGRYGDAGRVWDEIARLHPESPEAQAGLAVVAARNHELDRARKLFERAITMGAQDGSTYFEYALLLRDTGAPSERVAQLLEQAVATNPAYAEAHFLLGIRASDAGLYRDAVEHLRRATEILPRQAYFWQALSYANYKLGLVEDARRAAIRALHAAATTHEEEMARSVLRLIPPRKGDRTVAGALVEVDCGKLGARIHVRSPDGMVVVEVSDPRTVVLRGVVAGRTLSCGPQTSVPVTVEFEEDSNRVTAIEFH